jgi:hypothetical protein
MRVSMATSLGASIRHTVSMARCESALVTAAEQTSFPPPPQVRVC